MDAADRLREKMKSNGQVPFTERPIIKIAIIGLLVLVLLIPALFVQGLMHERSARKDAAVREIASKWGQEQTLIGPVISIPVRRELKDSDGDTYFREYTTHHLPARLNVTADVAPEIRYRGIYEAVLYRSNLVLEGVFQLNEPTAGNEGQPLLSRAYLSLGFPDLTGLRKVPEVSVAGKNYEVSAGTRTNELYDSGLTLDLDLTELAGQEEIPFRIVLDLNGSGELMFAPVGAETTVKMQSTWPSPSFAGTFLPVQREVGSEGFSAEWKVLHLNRNYPQSWVGNQPELKQALLGTKFLIGADVYQKSLRVTKYALVFFIFTFTAIFLAEILTRLRVHPIQYLLVGLAIAIFYALLIAISEHVNFDVAYIISSLLVTALVTFYLSAILGKRLGILVLGLLAVLYAFFYILLQLEDYALLLGALGIFALLATVMAVTRRIDWYDLAPEKADLSDKQ